MEVTHGTTGLGWNSAMAGLKPFAASHLSEIEYGSGPAKFRDAEAPRADSSIPAKPRVILIEDNEGDVFLVREAITEHGLTVNLDVISGRGTGDLFFINFWPRRR